MGLLGELLEWLFLPGRFESGSLHRRKAPRRYKPGSKMAEIHRRAMERKRIEAAERAEREQVRIEARRRAKEIARLEAAEQAARREARAEQRQERRPAARSAARPASAAPARGGDDLDDLARRLAAGEIRGAELGELFRTGKASIRRNPAAADAVALAKAERLSERFHGSAEHVMELAPVERVLPRYVVAVGEMPELAYRPRAGSERAGETWEHEAGDKGDDAPKSGRKPILAVDPETRRPLIVPYRSGIRFSGDRGLVG